MPAWPTSWSASSHGRRVVSADQGRRVSLVTLRSRRRVDVPRLAAIDRPVGRRESAHPGGHYRSRFPMGRSRAKDGPVLTAQDRSGTYVGRQ